MIDRGAEHRHALAIACWTMALALLPGAASAQWAYRTGETRHQQQANFCVDADDVEEIASLFERFGARTGFSALSAAPGCALEVHTFTPTRLVREVEMALASGDSYTIRFIHVELADGRARYVVTTRELHAER